MKTAVASPVVRWMNVEELRSLIAPHSAPCFSVYLATHPGGGPDDHAHYEGLLREARAVLAKHLSPHKVDTAVAPLESLFRPEDAKRSLAGLAVFHSEDFEAVYRVPMALPQKVVVADSFHVRPMLEYLQANQRYFLLLLSQGHVSFFKGSLNGLVPVDLRSMPRSLNEALGFEQHERNVRPHSGGAHGSTAIYSGRGRDDGSRDEDIARFFRVIDQELMQLLRDESLPLIVAAPEKQFGIYASVSRYPHLLHDGLIGTFTQESSQSLHERSWPIVERRIREKEKRVLEHYSLGISRDRASDDVSFIARGAIQGRVRELLVARKATLWGKLDAETGAIDLWREKKDHHDDDVLDDLAEAVLLRGGDVYSFDEERMPSESPVAATLRW